MSKTPKIKVIDNDPDGILFAAKKDASRYDDDPWVRCDLDIHGDLVRIDSSDQPALGPRQVEELIDWLTAARKQMVF